MELSDEQANLLLQLIEVATESNWADVGYVMVEEKGWSPEEIVSATEALADAAGCAPPLDLGDFN